MKKLSKMFLIIVFVLFYTQSFGQMIGVKAGLNLANQIERNDDHTYSDDYKIKPGFHLGGIVNIPIMDMISVEPGLQISTKGYKRKDGDYKEKLNLVYLECPVLGKFTYEIGSVSLIGITGPVFGIGLSGKYKTEYDGDKDKETVNWGTDDDEFRRPEVSFLIGAGIEMNSFQFTISYNMGLTNICNESNNGYRIKNRVIGLSAAYFFTEL